MSSAGLSAGRWWCGSEGSWNQSPWPRGPAGGSLSQENDQRHKNGRVQMASTGRPAHSRGDVTTAYTGCRSVYGSA